MAWLSLKMEAAGQTAEILSEALLALGALSVSIEDADADTPDEVPIFGEPGSGESALWKRSVVSALFDIDSDLDGIARNAAFSAGIAHFDYTVEAVPEQDWIRATQSQFEPIRVADRLWIVPSWHNAPQPDAINIVLDPGLAFGTGSHPTTYLCLAWLADHIQGGESVLDYGCGSGILAIAAKKLGAGETLGVDIDPQAILASRQNAAQNSVEIEFCLAEAMPPYTADRVIANILSAPLKVLAPLLAGTCRRGGRIALSGILAEQADEISALYGTWFDMTPPIFRENWALLWGTKR
ncbi:MAG: 50S ribosomal protein L11 methyltransferase [Methylophilaceae bacterium]|nr:50S ribosomal protein L11 methyltransferase [Methylophilaceae bacterium]